MASQLDYESVIRVLRDTGAGINAQEHHDPFLLAMGYAFDDVMRSLFHNVDAQCRNWRKALHVACWMKNPKAMQLLLDKRADFNIQFEEISSAMMSASCAGDKELVQLLLANGADIDARSGLYGNALQMSIYWCHEDVTRFLIDKGADINAIGGAYGNALAAASCGGPEDMVRLLLDKGADVNAHDVHYGSALQTAIFFGPENVIRLLLERGADVNNRSGYYGNPITAAMWLDRRKVVRLLFDNGADINSLDKAALSQAALLFGFGKCSESCMRRKLTSMLRGDLQAENCELCQKMGTMD